MIETTRHHEVFQASSYADKKIVLIGAGAIGSRVFENLASLGLTNITVIDFDVVESHNLANQLFDRRHLGQSKVSALMEWAVDKCGDIYDPNYFINGKADKHSSGWFEEASIVISCVDTFDARRLMLELARGAMAEVFFDTRMTSSSTELYSCHPMEYSSLQAYTNTLGDDDDPKYETSVCGASLTVGATAQIAGAQCCWAVMSWLKNGFAEPFVRTMMTPFDVSRV